MLRTIFCVTVLMAVAAPSWAEDAASMHALHVLAAAAPKPALISAYGPAPQQVGELRLPAGRGPFPVMVLIHGGCWEAGMGSPAELRPLAVELARRGVATWSLEYRRVGEPGGGYPGTFADVAAGVDALSGLAKTQPLDLSRVTVAGHSAGAHLALWAASRPKLHDPLAGVDPLPMRGVAAIDGPGALAPFVGVDAEVCGHPVIVPLMGGTPAEKPAAYRLASPADHVPLGIPQVLVLGELGPLMQPYVQAAKGAGDPVRVVQPQGADHFNILDTNLPQGRLVLDALAEVATASR